MRITWRMPALLMLAVVWPQLGCLHLSPDKSAVETRPPQPSVSAKPKPPEPTPEDKTQALMRQADSLEKIGKTLKAIALYERVRQSGGDFALNATKRLAIIHDRNNDLDRAEEEYQLLLQHNKNDADTLCNLGYIHYRRGHWHSAQKCFEDAIFHQPDHQYAWINLAMTLAQKNDYTASIETFKKYFSPAEAYCNVASVMNLQGKRDEAMRAYQMAINLNPKMDRAHMELARMESMPPLQYTPTTVAQVKLPPRKIDLPALPGNVELEEQPVPSKMAQASGESMSRLMILRPTLPPLPDVDLGPANGRDWDPALPKNNK